MRLAFGSLKPMLPRLGARISAAFRATVPDPFVLAILLTAVTFLAAVWMVGSGEPLNEPAWRAVLGMWQGSDGFWSLLAFGMQMCLILVTGHALAASPPIARLLRRLAGTPRTGRGAVAMVSSLAIGFGLINWGLGLIVGAILARDVGRAMRAKGVAAPGALLAAAGYTGMMTWHGGLSGSAPLDAADPAALSARVGPELAAAVGGSVPLSETTWTTLNGVTTLGLWVIVPVLLALMCPRADNGGATPTPEPGLPSAPAPSDDVPPGRIPRFLESSPALAWLLAAPMAVWLARQFGAHGLGALNLNTANLAFLALGLVLHGSPMRYASAIEEAARGCAGIVLQFPLYAGIIGMMKGSGLVAWISDVFVGASGGGEAGLSVMMFFAASIVNMFVPSGGGQWAVQGPIALAAAVHAGVSPGKLVMAVAYGDQLTNMLQPFWALPLLAITGCKARDIVGYTAIAMLAGGAWIALCLAIL